MKHHIKICLLLLGLLAWTAHGSAQVIYFPYYGKSKVLYEKFDWNHYMTEHFDIYYYAQDVKVLKTVAALAESAYQKISHNIKHQLSARVPLLYYMSTTDFAQTNLAQIPEGVLGVAEPILYRIALRGDMPVDELQDLIEHELTHIFEYDLLWGSPGGPLYAVSQPPGWIMEGFSEYSTDDWSAWSSLIVRDAVLNDRIPELNDSGHLFSRYPLPRPADYDFGHAIYEFIEEKYGQNGIREFWHSLKNSSLFGRRDPIKQAFKQNPRDFNYEFKKWIRERHKKFLLRENPEDYSLPLGPEFPLNPYYFSFSHAVSPSGEIVAIITYSVKDGDIDIVLLSAKDGSVLRNITKGYTTKYEQIKFEIDPSRGRDLTWSSDGDLIAFFARAGRKYSLFIVNALSGETIRRVKIPVDQPSAPCFLPGNREMLFTAFAGGNHDIFKLNLDTEKILNLTEDEYFEKAPSVSPDGRLIAYTVRIDTFDKIFLSPIDDLRSKTQITFGRGNTISPEFSADSKEIFFSGDIREAYNIYSVHLETGELKRYTDVRTGNFFPVPLPQEDEGQRKILFSSFNKGAFQVFISALEGETEKTIAFVEQDPGQEFKKFEPIISVEINEEEIKPYRGIGKLYLASRPPIDTILSTDGSIYGGSAISFTDLMGDHSFFLMAYQVRNFRSYYFSYLNQKRRWQYMVSAYQYTAFYYPPYAYYDPTLYNLLTYRDAIATRKISGVNLAGYYPFNMYYRVQANLSFLNYAEDFFDPFITQTLAAGGQSFNYFWNGNALAASFSLIGETTRFNYYGPMSGHTFRIALTQALPLSDSFISNTTFELDARKYFYIGGDTLMAFRFNGFASRGKNPYVFYFGGNNEVRSADYYSIIGHEGWYVNAEFRFPLVNAATTLIGQIGPVRGTLFFDIIRTKIKGFPAKFFQFTGDPANPFVQLDAIGSVGYGLEFFFLGLPIHLDFVKRLEFPKISSPFDFDVVGDFQTRFWIGYDF